MGWGDCGALYLLHGGPRVYSANLFARCPFLLSGSIYMSFGTLGVFFLFFFPKTNSDGIWELLGGFLESLLIYGTFQQV